MNEVLPTYWMSSQLNSYFTYEPKGSVELLNSPLSNKRYKQAFAPIEDSDQDGHTCSLTEFSMGAILVAKEPTFLQANYFNSGQTVRLCRLIWIFDVHIPNITLWWMPAQI